MRTPAIRFLSRVLAAAALAGAASLLPSPVLAGPNDPLNEVSGTEDWDRDDAAKRAKATQKDDFKDQLRDYDQTKRRTGADRDELKQERIIFQAVSSGGLPQTSTGYAPVPAGAPAPGRQDDWMRSEAEAIEGRFKAPPAPPPKPKAPPPPLPKKEETAEEILKKQKGHYDDSSGQFVDDELSEVSGKKKK